MNNPFPTTPKQVNVQVKFPGPGNTALSIQKGRSIIDLTHDELSFLGQIASLIAYNGLDQTSVADNTADGAGNTQAQTV